MIKSFAKIAVYIVSLIMLAGCVGASDNFRQTLGMGLNASPTQVETFDGGKLKTSGLNPFRPQPKADNSSYGSQVSYAEAYGDTQGQQADINQNLSQKEQFAQATKLVRSGKAAGAKTMKKLAEEGYTPAQYNMGVMYLTGNGVTKNQSQGVKFLRKAADRGHVKAASTMGAMYLQGKAVTRNTGQARRYLTKAAQKGDTQSILYLSLMYNSGDGVKQDTAKAYQWLLSVPSSQNSAQLKANRDKLAQSLSPNQRSQAESAAKAFKSRYGIG
ncbi:MAG: tetratricopeptide repeat protein [Alphaproteobacteria bacterium]